MTENDFEQEKKQIALERLKWVGRRKMAWVILFFWIMTTTYIVGWKDASDSKLLSDIYSWVSITTLSIVGAYMGFTTYANWKSK